MKVFISPPTETTWTIDPEPLSDALRARFAVLELATPSPPSAHAMEWTVSGSHGPVEGSLDVAGNGVVLDGDIEDCADFALWFRGLVPERLALVFYDESYSAEVPLRHDTQRRDLISPFVE